MVSSEINLIQGSGVSSKIKKVQLLKNISILSLFLVALLAVLLFIVGRLYTASPVRQKQAEILRDMTYLSDKQGQIILINDRIVNINRIMSQRKDYGEVLNSILTNMPSDVTINSLKVVDNKIALTVSSGSLSSLNDFINKLISMASNKEIVRLLIESLSYNNRSSSYVLALDIDSL